MATRTYDTGALLSADPSSKAWAVAYVRHALRDIPNDADTYPEGSLTDVEIEALIEFDTSTDTVAGGGDGTVYYRPHITAARILKSDPTRVRYFQAAGTGYGPVDPVHTASRIERAGRVIDLDIADTTSGRVAPMEFGRSW